LNEDWIKKPHGSLSQSFESLGITTASTMMTCCMKSDQVPHGSLLSFSTVALSLLGAIRCRSPHGSLLSFSTVVLSMLVAMLPIATYKMGNESMKGK
jgi:hypothetical protein